MGCVAPLHVLLTDARSNTLSLARARGQQYPRRNMRYLLATMTGLGLATAINAHPHIFVDSAIHPIFDRSGQLVAVRVIWAYDDLYSELIFEDRGLELEEDGSLGPDALAALRGFDMNWAADFDGDLYVTRGATTLALSPPISHGIAVARGQIVSTHIRTFEAPITVSDAPVIFGVYDPSYYTAYTITLGSMPEGRNDCEAVVYEPDADAAYALLEEALAEYSASALAADEFPAVGAAFAEELRLSCPSTPS